MIKALQWFGKAWLQTFAFCGGILLLFIVGTLLVTYPLQLILTVVGGFAVYVMFLFIFEL